MITSNRTLGGFGLVVAVLAALSVTACDPYIGANNASPTVIGVSMTDTSYNEVAPPDSPGCVAPYPQVDKAWADQVYPGLCNPDNIAFGIPTVCPVLCYPPRMGPGYAPLYTGNLGGTYQTTLLPNTYTYQLPTAYVLGAVNKVPPIYENDETEQIFSYGTIRILFNKLLDPKTVQPDPLDCKPPTGAGSLKVFLGTTDVTATHPVCYNPNSDTEYWGASITVTSPKLINLGTTANPFLVPILENNATYRVVGAVADQQGNQLNVDVTVITGDDLIVPAPPAAR